mmetsp:Transcript_48805/g.114602  ORF Transcript_48805/g.114602 Transcript_48805/m.114602 type:complete len:324 (+) Transcript_48805:1298-2269(+)
MGLQGAVGRRGIELHHAAVDLQFAPVAEHLLTGFVQHLAGQAEAAVFEAVQGQPHARRGLHHVHEHAPRAAGHGLVLARHGDRAARPAVLAQLRRHLEDQALADGGVRSRPRRSLLSRTGQQRAAAAHAQHQQHGSRVLPRRGAAMARQHAHPLHQRVASRPATGEGRLQPGRMRGQHGFGIGGQRCRAGFGDQHGGVAGQFLVTAHPSPGPPGQRVEPLQAQQPGAEQVPGVVVAARMHGFMGQHQLPGRRIEALLEVSRQHQALRPDADDGGTGAGGCQPLAVGVAAQACQIPALQLHQAGRDRQRASGPGDHDGQRHRAR